MMNLLYFFCRYWPLVTVPCILYAYTIDHSVQTCQKIFRIPVAGKHVPVTFEKNSVLNNTQLLQSRPIINSVRKLDPYAARG